LPRILFSAECVQNARWRYRFFYWQSDRQLFFAARAEFSAEAYTAAWVTDETRAFFLKNFHTFADVRQKAFAMGERQRR